MSSILLAQAVKRTALWRGFLCRNASSGRVKNHAFIALGSNVGNPIKNIEDACRELDKAGLQVIRTSHLYETEPMYYAYQAKFINGVCKVAVDDEIEPLELLARLQHIEQSLGREKTIEKGPRNIDLDILLFRDQIWESPELSIPHRTMLEREFVLRPLCDLIPHATHPKHGLRTYKQRLDELALNSPRMSTVTALGELGMIKHSSPERRTLVMAIINLTPDSFSDGGVHFHTGTIVRYAQQQVKEGASIIDIGGCSTRPGAPEIPVEEELDRVIPTIQAVAKIRYQFPKLNISIDTWRHQVAEAAIEAGADIVNDVSAGRLDPKMHETVARLGCTYIAMHSRGTPETMKDLTEYNSGVIQGVTRELVKRVREAEDAGIRKWRMILDPGIGFAKNRFQNLELICKHRELEQHPRLGGFSWLVGSSRKEFIGRITHVRMAGERIWGTAAAVTASVLAGADIVRVHDVQEMAKVVRMADAIRRYDTVEEGDDYTELEAWSQARKDR